MKKNLVIVFFICSYIAVAAQDKKVGISFFQNYSTFRYINSEGNKDDMDYTIKFGYGLLFQQVFGKHLLLEGLVLYNNKGATSSLDLDQLDWSFHYVNAGINLGYKFMIGKLYPQLGAGFYYGRLLKADQYIGSAYYDLMVLNEINKNDFGVNMFGGLEYDYSDNGSLFLKINESIGLLQLEELESGQKIFNRTFSIQLGLLFPINKNLP
ncbi:MAG: outer membrane beta-barrel protein [Bacteroidales bacterium]